MGDYGVEREFVDGHEVLCLTDNASKSRARIIPSIGNNLIQLISTSKPVIQGPRQASDLTMDQHYFKYGIPILFPPNRVGGGTFTFAGKQYQLPLNEPHNHIHGELASREWVVTHMAADVSGALVTSVFRITDHPDIFEYFPHELEFTVTYTLCRGQLLMKSKIENRGESTSPFAFGLHPYFLLPNLPDSDIFMKATTVSEWPVDDECFIQATGSETPLVDALNNWMPLTAVKTGGCRVFSLADKKENFLALRSPGIQINITLRGDFRFLVIFRPLWERAISFEPYTYLTDGFNLPWSSDVTGVRGLEPGDQVEFEMVIEAKECG